MSDALLQIDQLTVRFGASTVVDQVSFHIAAGEKFALVGESGSGKSITALSVLRLVDAATTTGSIRFDGEELTTKSEREMRGVMAHELAHVFTPELAGKEEGEDFADDFAGALLFPKELAHHAYVSASHRRTPSSVIGALHDFARDHMISLFSVFNEVKKYAEARGLSALKVPPQQVHAARNSDGVRGELVSATLFRPLPPEPAVYIAAAHSVFKSAFFTALEALLRERGTGAGYVQQVMSVPLADAQAIHDELLR